MLPASPDCGGGRTCTGLARFEGGAFKHTNSVGRALTVGATDEKHHEGRIDLQDRSSRSSKRYDKEPPALLAPVGSGVLKVANWSLIHL